MGSTESLYTSMNIKTQVGIYKTAYHVYSSSISLHCNWFKWVDSQPLLLSDIFLCNYVFKPPK